MKTQISRASFNAQKRYSGVYQQMGRMLTDADWNEFSDLAKHRLAEAITDIIGSGSPRGRGVVEVVPQADGTNSYALRWGYFYVDGIQGQVRPVDPAIGDTFDYGQQQDFPLAPALPDDYLLYVDLWERTVLPLEDADLMDAGLHGADTCSRTQTMAQVKWCEPGVHPEDPAANPAIGDALLALVIRQGSTEPDPCDPCADEIALQDKVGNYLFRMEVHDVQYDGAGLPEQVTLKWSSENGAEQYSIDDLPLGFKASHWAYEFYHGESQDFASEKHLGKHLAPAFAPERGQLNAGYPETEPAGYELVRRWDGYCTLEKSAGNWILVADSGFDKGTTMSSGLSSDAHGHVAEGASVELNLDNITATLELADWQALAGDFWQADVRQAVHTAGSEILPASTPQGILHHYLLLGRVTDGEFNPHDGEACKRFDFPPLTDIRAGDVCYDNSACEMPEVNTVQDALDHLCQSRDLRWHNKHLHGWGIVYGLIAECCPDHPEGSDEHGHDHEHEHEHAHEQPITEAHEEEFDSKRSVCVTAGYALTCEGDDLVLSSKRSVPVMEQIEALEESGVEILSNGDGSVFLRIDPGPNGEPAITVEAYDPEKHKKSPFEGTLLMDFFQNCVMDLIDAVRNEFNFLDNDEISEIEGGSTGLVSQQRRKYISLFNLIIQFLRPTHGSYVFLSHREHLILRDFYLQLRELLRSKTFCAMFDDDEFPEYPFSGTEMTTYFGKNFHTRVHVSQDGKFLYSYMGADNTINVYDTTQGQLIKLLEMPSAEGAQITSITTSKDGSLLYAAASVREVDTVFGLARVNDDYAWEDMTILCDMIIAEMVTSPDDEGLIYATAKGKGLYYLRPEILFAETKPQPEPAYAFNAVGHLAIDFQQQVAHCTASSTNGITTSYNQIASCNLVSSEDVQTPLITPLLTQNGEALSGSDGLAIRGGGQEQFRCYVVVRSEKGEKYLLTYHDLFGQQSLPRNMTAVEDTSIALAYHHKNQQLVLSFEDSYRLQVFDADGNALDSWRTPVQIQPTDLTIHQESGRVYAINFLSNTISHIPAIDVVKDDGFVNSLFAYRSAILLAFYSLLGNVLQYLKDCFCHHLLVKCPTCDDDPIYLARVEIRNGEVYNICNFDKRKYVKSFVAVDHWMSLIPVMPLIKNAVSQFCCAIIPNVFAKYQNQFIKQPATSAPATSAPVQGDTWIKAEHTRNAIQTYQRTDAKAMLRNQRKGGQVLTQFAGDRAINFIQQNQVNLGGVNKQSLIKANTSDAVTELQKHDVNVATVETYDASKAGQYMADYTSTPQHIAPGSEVVLVEKDGKVMHYAVKQPQTSYTMEAVPESLKTEIQNLENRKAQLADFEQVEAKLAQVENRRQSLAETEALSSELASLQQQKADMQAEIAGLKSEVSSIQQTRLQEESKLAEIETLRANLAQDIDSLSENLNSLDSMRKDLALEVNRTRPINDLGAVDAATATSLTKAGIRTVDELANANVDSLAESQAVDRNKLSLAKDEARRKLGLL